MFVFVILNKGMKRSYISEKKCVVLILDAY